MKYKIVMTLSTSYIYLSHAINNEQDKLPFCTRCSRKIVFFSNLPYPNIPCPHNAERDP